MPDNNIPERDPNYEVRGLPPFIKAKVTQLVDASMNYAFKGTHEDADIIEQIGQDFHWRRHCLEQSIKTAIEQAATEAVQEYRESKS